MFPKEICKFPFCDSCSFIMMLSPARPFFLLCHSCIITQDKNYYSYGLMMWKRSITGSEIQYFHFLWTMLCRTTWVILGSWLEYIFFSSCAWNIWGIICNLVYGLLVLKLLHQVNVPGVYGTSTWKFEHVPGTLVTWSHN